MINPFLYFLLFLKASLFSSGGFSNLPSLHQDLPAAGWAHEEQFGQSLAIGQISPGPNGLWVISLGYLTYGVLGALLSLIAISLPPLFVLALSAGYHQIAHQAWVPGLMRGISLAVVGIQLSVSWSIMSRNGTDWRAWLIVLATCLVMLSKKVPLLLVLVLAGIVGFLLYH
jgi:chromate transporter